MYTIVRVVLLLGAACLAVSCSKSSDAAIRKLRPAVEAKLAAIKAIGQLLPNEIVPTGAPFQLTGPQPEFGTLGGKTNAMIMEDGQFAYPSPEKEGLHFALTNPIADPLSLLSRGEFHGGRPGNPSLHEELLRNFIAIRYVLVFRGLEVVEPVVQPKQAANPRDRSLQGIKPDYMFKSGIVTGDMILFDLDQGKSVGGWRIYEENSNKLSVSSADQRGYLLGDLRRNAVQNIAREFQRRYPTATPPFSGE